MSDERHSSWDAALRTMKKLRAAGHVALLAGGCVRDRLLRRTPKDYDVVTDATPERVHEFFPHARKVGAAFGVMLVRKFGHNIEVATFRSDGPYSDGRHPDAVTFGTDVEDAQRRDFTINGLFFDPFDDRVIDYVGGQADLDARIVRTIGDPHQRFAEDHLRMLRAVRFAAQLGFQIHPDTTEAMRQLAAELSTISPERVWMELAMLLTDPSRANGWALLMETGLRPHLSPAWPENSTDDAIVQARLTALPPHPVDASLALAATLGSFTPDAAQGVCHALRLSNQVTRTVTWLIRSLPTVRAEASLELADLKLMMAQDAWPDLLELLTTDLTTVGPSLEAYERIRDRASAIPAAKIAPPPLLSGRDLCDLGMSPGPRFGQILDAVYRHQLNEQITSREAAVARARELMLE